MSQSTSAIGLFSYSLIASSINEHLLSLSSSFSYFLTNSSMIFDFSDPFYCHPKVFAWLLT